MILLLLILALAQPEMPPVQVTGGITFYYNEFEGRGLKCPGYKYEESTGPWIAVDVSWYESGWVECGDWFLLTFYDGSTMIARALDSGYLDYRLWPDKDTLPAWDSGLPYVADLPKYWREGRETRTGTILNLSLLFRVLQVVPFQ